MADQIVTDDEPIKPTDPALDATESSDDYELMDDYVSSIHFSGPAEVPWQYADTYGDPDDDYIPSSVRSVVLEDRKRTLEELEVKDRYNNDVLTGKVATVEKAFNGSDRARRGWQTRRRGYADKLRQAIQNRDAAGAVRAMRQLRGGDKIYNVATNLRNAADDYRGNAGNDHKAE